MKYISPKIYFVLLSFIAMACTQKIKSHNYTLWYTYPAKYWNSQGLHLGNGYFGATFLGKSVV